MRHMGRAAAGVAAVCLAGAVLAACGGSHSASKLTVKVIDLPHGVGGDVTVHLPNGSHRSIHSTTSFSQSGHYTVGAVPVTVGSDQYAPTQAKTTATLASGRTTTVTVDYADIVPSTTKVLSTSGLSGATLSPNVASGPGTITFPPGAPLPSGLAVGDVLASGATPQTPDGLLVKVVSITTGASGTTVTTTPASLPEALTRGRLQIDAPIGPAQNVALPPGVTPGATIPLTSATPGAVPGRAQLASYILTSKPTVNIKKSLPAFTLSPAISVDVSQAEKGGSSEGASSGESEQTSCNPSGATSSQSGSTSTSASGGVSKQELAAGLDVRSTVSLQPTLHLSASWGFLQPLTASFSVTLNEASKTDVEADMAYSCIVKANLPSTPFALDRIPFVAGIIPGEIKVGLQGQGSITGTFAEGIDIGADQSANVTIGLKYDNGKFKPMSHFTNKLSLTANPVVTLSAKAAVGPSLTFELDDQAGPEVNLQGSVSAVVSSDQKKSGVFLGANAGVGFQLNIFGLPQMDYKTSIPLWKTKVWPPKAGSGPTTTTTSTVPPSTTTSTPGPSWVSSLGAGVTTVPPGSSPSPGHGSPGGVAEANTADINAGNLTAACGLLEPSAQAACTQATTGQSSSGVSYQNFGLGYIAIDGNEALVGTVGTYCNPNYSPTCFTNSDPAAVFSSGQTFATLYNAAVAAAANSTPSNNYSLAPCIEIGGAWYLNAPG
jgi:hypothetical protein